MKTRTRILATLGPATSSYENILALARAGASGFRLNFSHGSVPNHEQRVEHIRKVEREIGRPIPIVADLQGPKIRIGEISSNQIFLDMGDEVNFDLDSTPGTNKRIPLLHKEVFESIKTGDRLVLDDGNIHLQIKEVSFESIKSEVLVGGNLSSKKGVSFPDTRIFLPSLTKKDLSDLDTALQLDVEYIALSFVQHPNDLIEARKKIGNKCGLIAKIEKPGALDHLEEIIEKSDVVMVARGDLGVELPPEVVPIQQRRILAEAIGQGRPVIIATQMLESMCNNSLPTRAETSDVANAVYGLADTLMLSGETAVGKYPTEAVSMMYKIITRIEQEPSWLEKAARNPQVGKPSIPDAVTLAAHEIAEKINAACIVTHTQSGSTTLRASRQRRRTPIISLTPSIKTARRLMLAWGVTPDIRKDFELPSEMVRTAVDVASQKEGVSMGDPIVITAGVPLLDRGTTNLLRVEKIQPKKVN